MRPMINNYLICLINDGMLDYNCGVNLMPLFINLSEILNKI